MRWLSFIALLACSSNRDTLTGSWNGEWECGDLDYNVDSVISETQKYEYEGEMLFRYTREVADGTFYANLLYNLAVTQLYASGNQELYFDMEWADLGCKTIFDDDTEEVGGCVANGLNTDDLDEDIGDVPVRFDGGDRLIIDDGNCQGILYRE